MIMKKAESTERLLSVFDVAMRIGVNITTVRRHMHELMASGLQRVEIGGRTRLIRFREDSLNRMIRRAVERDEPLIKNSCVQSGPGVSGPVNT